MGADLISVGVTVKPAVLHNKKIDHEQTIKWYMGEILKNINQIDIAEVFEPDMPLEPQDVADTLMSAVRWLTEPGRHGAEYGIPGNEELVFILGGGSSWGDSPFDEFDAVCMLANAVEILPGLGRSLGVLGNGILLDFETPA